MLVRNNIYSMCSFYHIVLSNFTVTSPLFTLPIILGIMSLYIRQNSNGDTKKSRQYRKRSRLRFKRLINIPLSQYRCTRCSKSSFAVVDRNNGLKRRANCAVPFTIREFYAARIFVPNVYLLHAILSHTGCAL